VAGGTGKIRLEDWLCGEFSTLSRMYLRSLIRDGMVEVNGRHENAGYKVRGGDLVEVEADMSRGTSMVAEDIPLDLVFEDDAIIVVDKPAGMLVHPSHREKTGTLLNALTFHINQEVLTRRREDAKAAKDSVFIRPGLIHRLDKDTSGLIVIAKTAAAHRVLCRHFMKKRVEKRYAALVEGVVEPDEGTIDAPIGRHAELKHWSVKEGGKLSQTRFWVRQRNKDTTLVELEPVTGRTNQLRIHCELIGHPIVGDTRRGGREFERLCLHAVEMSFPHPATGERVTFNSPSPFA
jgi:23S rRNA pseudouridine1911/1915/1917 synthase